MFRIFLSKNFLYYFPANPISPEHNLQISETQYIIITMKSLKDALGVLNSCVILVFIAFLLDVIHDFNFFQELGAFGIILLLPLKISFFSGAYGVLAELAGGEEFLLKFDHWKENCKKFWKIYFILTLWPLVLYAFLTTILPKTIVPSPLIINNHVDIFILFFLARFLIARKYIRPLKLTRSTLRLNLADWGMILLVYAVKLFVFYLPLFFDIGIWNLQNLTGFILRYLEMLMFLLIVGSFLDAYPQIREKFNPEKEIFIVNPLGGWLPASMAYMLIKKYPPVFVILKALTPKDYHIREFNLVKWQNRYFRENKLVAVTCYTSTCAEGYKLAKEFKRRGCKVIMGGPHVSYLPDEALSYCDSVVIGEAEGVWPEIIKDYERQTLKPKYFGGQNDTHHNQIHQALLNSSPGIIKDFLETSRGCKFRCHFCTVPSLHDGRVRAKPVFEIVELIEKIRSEYQDISFIDNNIYNDPFYTEELFKALKPLNVRWTSSVTIDIAKNEKLMRLAKESGCRQLLIGFEIIGDSPEIKKRGKFGMAEKYLQFARTIKKAGIKIQANFIFGFETDRAVDLFKIWKFCLSMWPFCSKLSCLTPLPGSKVYFDTLQDNRLTNLNWRYYDSLHLVFRHPHANNFILERCFPLISICFSFTTSPLGFTLLVFLISIIIFGEKIWFF